MSDDSTQAGYAAWERGEPFDKFQYAAWQDGWMVAFDNNNWRRLAEALGATVLGFSGDYAATFSWPDGSLSSIDGGLLKALRRLTTPCDTDGSPKGPDRNGLDGEAATAGAAESGIAQKGPAHDH